MKKKFNRNLKLKWLTTLCLVIGIVPTSSTYAQTSFLDPLCLSYLNLYTGQAHFPKVQGSSISGERVGLKSTSNTIVGAGVGLGVDFGDKFRSDIIWFRHLDPLLKSSNSRDIIKRKPLIDAYFANIYYEIINNIGVFNPYIGAGVGFSKIKDKVSVSSINNNQISREIYTVKGRKNFAYRLVIGSSFDLNESIKFDLSYNYHDYGKTKSRLDNTQTQIGQSHYKSHIIGCGLRIGI